MKKIYDYRYSGIYAIKNKINNKVYIGSAIDIYNRWRDHKRDLSKNKSKCRKLQNAWTKYGKENFEFICLCCILDINKLYPLEQSFINQYNSYNNGYNLCPVAGSRLGFKESEETKIKRKRLIINRCKNVIQYNLKDQYINKYNHATEASKITHVCHQSIIMCCNGQRYAASGFKWRYENSTIKQKINNKIRPVIKLDMNNNFIEEYNSIKEACYINNFNPKSSGHISCCCKGRKKQFGGYLWKYK